MKISPLMLTWLTAGCFLWGIATGVLHDVNRLIRLLLGGDYRKTEEQRTPLLILSGSGFGHFLKTVLVAVQDIVLFLFGTLGYVLLSYRLNHGRPRLLPALALVLGFVIYYFTAGRLLLNLSELVTIYIKKTIFLFWKILNIPLGYFVEFVGNFVTFLKTKLKKTIAKKRKKVYTIHSKKQIFKKAERGFLGDRLPPERKETQP